LKSFQRLTPLGTLAKRRTAKQLINNHPAVLAVIPTGLILLQHITETYTTPICFPDIYDMAEV
jgi:hypothetical protein